MQIQGVHQTHAASPSSPTSNARGAGNVGAASKASSIAADELELSAEAIQISRVQSSDAAAHVSNGIRSDRVAQLRQAIASGTYETPEKLSQALDRLLDTFA